MFIVDIWSTTALIRVTAVAGLFVALAAGSSCGSRWPPVVSTAAEASALPLGEKSVRCIGCDDAALAVIRQRLQDLDYLFINDQARITDEGIRAISTLRRLRQLVVDDASRLTDASLQSIQQLPALEELSIDHGPMFSASGLGSLGDGSKLRSLYLAHCVNANAETVQLLRRRLPGADVRASE